MITCQSVNKSIKVARVYSVSSVLVGKGFGCKCRIRNTGTKRNNLIPVRWTRCFRRATTCFLSLIYQSFVFDKEIIDGHSPTVIVIIPLSSFIHEQLTSDVFNLKAAELTLQDDVLKKCERRQDGGCLDVSRRMC